MGPDKDRRGLTVEVWRDLVRRTLACHGSAGQVLAV